MKPKSLIILFCMLLMLGCTNGDGGLKDLLPSRADLGGIKAQGSARIYEGDRLFDYMDGGAELYYEYNFVRACVQRYQTSQGGVTVEIYQMDIPAHAYGIYTFEAQGEHPLLGQDATYKQGLVTFWKGIYFVRVYSQDEGDQQPLLALGHAIARQIPHEGARPDILKHLPSQGVEGDSLLYFRGMIALNNAYFFSHQNILSLSGTSEGVTFTNRRGFRPLRTIMVHYPGAPQAETAFQTLCASGAIKGGRMKDGLFMGTSRKGYGGAKRAGELLIVVLDGENSSTVARALASLPQKEGE